MWRVWRGVPDCMKLEEWESEYRRGRNPRGCPWGVLTIVMGMKMQDIITALADRQEHSLKLVGNDETDSLYRAAGASRVSEGAACVNASRYSCPCCGRGADRMMRVRLEHHPRWIALCAMCSASMIAKFPGTMVGGLIRPARRRRTRRVERRPSIRRAG